MGYVKTSFPSLSSAATKIAYLENPSNGVCYNKDDLYLQNGQSPDMVNLEAFSGVLRTRAGQCSVFGKDPLCSSFHSITKQPFYNATILHNGTNLYKLSSGKSPELLFSDMPDANSVFVEFKAKLYIYTSLRIYSVDKNFKVIEEMPYAPLLYNKYSASSISSGTQLDEKLNLAAPVLKVSYRNCEETRIYNLPIKADVQRPFQVLYADQILSPDTYTVEEKKVTLNEKTTVDDDHPFSISFFAQNPEDIGFEDKFSKCTLGATFGGTIVSGTRVFMTGNSDLPGYYFTSELLAPLRFDEDSYDIIGSGNENITAMIKQYGNLVVFTDRSVFKMTYEYQDSETIFSVKELNHYIGCDVPRSVEIIDNRIVFANSSKGVFLIDSSEDFGEQNIKPISGNINEGSSVCLLSRDKEALRNAFSIDFNRKYYLCVGNYVYVWDYNARYYSSSSDYSTSQQKLVWYVFCGIKAHTFFELDGLLYTAGTQIDSGFAVFKYEGKDFDKPIQYSFTSAKTYLSYPHLFKSIREIILDINCESNTKIGLFDRKEKFFEYLLNHIDNKVKSFKVPLRRTHLFNFSVSGQGNMEFSNICVKFKLLN